MPRKKLRTTIAIKREHHLLLRALAAKRGLRGYSEIVAEALDLYFRDRAKEVEELLSSQKTKRKAKPKFDS
ncbi:MAG: hypothetical protein ACP5JD_07680 [Candidatus Bipolaricaulaceae bacterium]